MSSFSRVILVGRLVRDAELRSVSSTQIANFTVAVDENRKDKDGSWKKDTSFIDCTLFGRQAELITAHAGKGSLVLVDGRLRQEQWEKNGEKKSRIKVNGDKYVLLSEKKQHAQSEESSYAYEHDADIPF